MSKVGFLIIGFLCGVLLPSLYAWKQVDEANMAQPDIRVIKEYSGQFRGWQDDCLNCDVVSKGEARGRSSRGGYCECNCQQEEKHLKF